MWKYLFIADPVIIFDKQFAQLDHGRENWGFQLFWFIDNKNAFRVTNCVQYRY